jgi:hypothetical protein
VVSISSRLVHEKSLGQGPFSTVTKESRRTPFKFAVGDRVAEKPRIHLGLAVKQENQRRYSSRLGTVTELRIKARKDGHQRKYLAVRWDGFTTPSEHEQMRICAAEELQTLEQDVILNHD